MSTPIFSKQLEPIRTKDTMTVGIVNIPLTYPARIWFVFDQSDMKKINDCYTVLENFHIPFERSDIVITGKCKIQSIGEVEPKVIKNIFRNFRSLRPRLDSNYRYPFWEIDTKDYEVLAKVLDLYRVLGLPVYVHESMQGYHFLCVKPIPKEKFAWFITQVRDTNPKYPPITLRIKPNKYVGEENVFYQGGIVSDTLHRDTVQLKELIEKQDIRKLQQNYMIVFYGFENRSETVI